MHKGILSINKYGQFEFFKIKCQSIGELDINVLRCLFKNGSPIGATAIKPSIPPSRITTTILPCGKSFVYPEVGMPASARLAEEV